MSRIQPNRTLHLAAVVLGLAGLALVAVAQDDVSTESPWSQGPGTFALGDVAAITLGENHLFADAESSRQLLRAAGNPTDGSEVGLVTSIAEDEDWFVLFELSKVGYVTDDDQDEIDADGLFKTISEATEAGNEERAKLGASALHVTRWSEAPHYDAASHNLVWALEAANDDGETSVNYNVRLLGRQGYMSVTLVTDPEMLDVHKPEIEKVLAGFTYDDGERYADFRSGDKLAGYGLAALVAGGAGAAAAKLGLFAVLGKFLGKIWKLIVVGAVALGGAVKRLFGGGRREEPSAG